MLITIILMMASSTKSPRMDRLRDYNTQRIINDKFFPVPVATKLATNPFLKDQEKYQFLIHKLNDYNKRISSQAVTDQYEAKVYENLHKILCDIIHIDQKEQQIERLEQILSWYQQQYLLIGQRKDQGQVRYKVTRQSKAGVSVQEKVKPAFQKNQSDQIPSEAIARNALPYRKGWRTAHKQVDIPTRRLKEYKRKVLNFSPFIEPKQQKIQARVLYPKVPKFEPKYDEPQQNPEEGQQPLLDADGQPIPQIPVEGQAVEVHEGDQNAEQEQNAGDQQQDLGGFGQQPAEPEQEQPVEVEGEDKLAPKVKSFTIQFSDIKRKEYTRPYMFYKGEQNAAERRMEEKYMKIYNKNLNKQKQQIEQIQYIEQWAQRKSKIEKDRQKKLENKIFNSHYVLSHEEPLPSETMSKEDQIKYGFTTNLRTKPRHSQINISGYHLPKIGQENNMFEKSIRSDRIKSLKKKFGKLLNLQEAEDREVAPSICQYSSRKRGLSEVLKNHSRSKQRLYQLDEVTRIKEKLSRNRVGVDIRSLSMGLCLPQDDVNPPETIIASKDLPSNPFMVETKKKKKK